MFSVVVANAAGISAIVAAIALVVTVVRAVFEYSKQNLLRRFEKYQELSTTWFEDKDIQDIITLLEEDPEHKLRTWPYRKKEAFIGFYEEVALMLESKLIQKRIAYYMFGYYTIQCDKNQDFWADINKESPYWSLFRRFAAKMKKIDNDIHAGYEDIDNWKFRF